MEISQSLHYRDGHLPERVNQRIVEHSIKVICRCCKIYREDRHLRNEFHLIERLNTDIRCKKCRCIPRIVFYRDEERVPRWQWYEGSPGMRNFIRSLRWKRVPSMLST